MLSPTDQPITDNSARKTGVISRLGLTNIPEHLDVSSAANPPANQHSTSMLEKLFHL